MDIHRVTNSQLEPQPSLGVRKAAGEYTGQTFLVNEAEIFRPLM